MKGARNSCLAECQKGMTRGERASCGGKLREGGQRKVRQSEVVGMLQLVFLRWNKQNPLLSRTITLSSRSRVCVSRPE